MLLTLNRWLPGGWPGGGGGGFRERPQEALTDPTRVRPSETPVEWPPPEGVRVEVRAPEGTTLDDASLAAADGAGERPAKDARLTDAAAFRDGFRVRRGAWTLRHAAPPPSRADAWVVYVPAGEPPSAGTTPASPPTLRTRVVDARSGAPIADAQVRLVRDGLGRPLAVGRDGAVEVPLAEEERPEAHLEVRAPGRPVTVVRADAVGETVRVPEGRVVEVRVTDPEGRRPVGATVTARYAATPAAGSAEPIDATDRVEAGEDGTARVVVPEDGAVDLLGEALDRAPAARRVSPADGVAPVSLALEKGLAVPVRVVGPDGEPLADAEVIGVASVEGVRVRRSALAGADGRANVGPFGPGEVELYAKARGHVWTATSATVAPGAATTEIHCAAGAPLALVVETPEGAPVAGARVRLAAEEGGTPDVLPPDAPPFETDEKGVLVIPDLPERPFTVRIDAPGRRPERLGRVRPGRTTYYATLAPR
jgi:hypothetical protein